MFTGMDAAKVMIDVDGILYPFVRAFSEALPGGPFAEDDCHAWKRYPGRYARHELEAAHHWAHRPASILRHGLYPGAAAAVARLRAAGAHVTICTRRAREASASSAEALASLGVSWDGWEARPDVDKVDFCQARGIGIVIDDKPATLTAAAGAGLHALSLRWAYNQHLAQFPGVQLAGGWDELERLVAARLPASARSAA